VVNAITEEPVRKATVVLRAMDRGAAAYSSVTDASGHFAIASINPGKYHVSAERVGFARQEFGAKRPNQAGAAVVFSPAESRKGLDIRLTPQGVITGRVLDEDGDPVQHVMVGLLRRVFSDGRRQLMPASQSASTNDLGEYRIFGLAPGRYYLSAVYRRGGYIETGDSGEGREAYPPTFFPGATAAEGAAPLDVAPGATLQGVDIRLQKIPAVRVAGRVVTPDNQPARAIVMLRPHSDAGSAYMGQEISRAFDRQGRFQFSAVTPGSYFLTAQMNGEDERLWARMPVEVGASNIDGLVLTLVPGAELSGVVKFEGSPESSPSGLRVFLDPESRIRGSASPVRAGGAFTLPNVMPDRYHVNVAGLPDTSYVKSIYFGSADVSSSGLDLTHGLSAGELIITISGTAAHVEGAVQSTQGQPAPAARVVLLPEKPSDLSRPKTAVTDQDGRFSIGGLSPGEYRAYAFEEIDDRAWEDPEFMKPFENNAEKISVKDNDRQTTELKLIAAQ
jgi:protocatechuate 3,4-dioxygenase beta subunit